MNVSVRGGLPVTCLPSAGAFAIVAAVWKLGFICIIYQQR